MTEERMKEIGEERVWAAITPSGKSPVKISSTQIGQQMIIGEVYKILPLFKDWINNKSYKKDRTHLKEVFSKEGYAEESIALILLLIAGNIYYNPTDKTSKVGIKRSLRHSSIVSIENKVFLGKGLTI